MSLINQMLKDLEARRQQQEPGAQCTVSVTPCQQQPDNRSVKLLGLAAVVVVLGLVGGGWWYFYLRPKGPVVVSVNEKIITQQQSPVPAAQLAQLPALAKVITAAPEEMPHPVAIAPEAVTSSAVVNTVPAPLMLKDAPVVSNGAPSQPSHPVQLNDVAMQKAAPDAVMPTATAQKSPATAAAVLISKPPSVAQQAQQLRLQAQRQVQAKNYIGAAELLQQALSTVGGSAAQWHQLAIAHLQAGQLPAACRVADAGCQHYPQDSSLRVMQARLLLEMGNKEQALAALQFIPPPPINRASDYYALLATLLQQSGDLVNARNNYQLLTTAFPQRGDWWIGRAICAEQLGQLHQATGYFEQALRCPQLQPQLKQYALQQLQRLAKG